MENATNKQKEETLLLLFYHVNFSMNAYGWAQNFRSGKNGEVNLMDCKYFIVFWFGMSCSLLL